MSTTKSIRNSKFRANRFRLF